MNPQQIFDALNARFHSDESVASFLPDHASLDLMYERIVGYAGRLALAPYSELVSGIAFRQETLYGDRPHFIEPGPWIGQDRRMIGTALAHIAIEHLRESNALITSIVVLKDELRPSSILFEWLADCGVLPVDDERAVYEFWGTQIQATFQWGRRMAQGR